MKVAFYKAYQSRAEVLDKLIAICSFGRHSHVELVFPNGECFSISARDGKARFKNIELHPDRWDVYELDESVKEEEVRSIAEKYLGFKYDFVGAISSVFPICVQKEQRIFCSEIVTDIIKQFEGYTEFEKGCNYSPSRLKKEILEVEDSSKKSSKE